MNILVIGGAGYIGSHVAKHFYKANAKVTIFDNLSTGNISNIIKSDYSFINGDITNVQDFEKLTGTYDCIIHLAAFKNVADSMTELDRYSINNLYGSINVLNFMIDRNIKNIVFSSSCSIYGIPQYTPIDENHPKNPESFYGFTKLKIEELIEWYSKLKKINYAFLRYFNVAGYDIDGELNSLERNSQNLLPCIFEALTGKRKEFVIYGNDYKTHDGTCIRDYIHVDDIANAHLKAFTYLINKNKNLILNLGTGIGSSVLDIIESVEKVTGKKVIYNIVEKRPGDPPKAIASYAKAKEVLYWEPINSKIETIVDTTWNTYLRHV